MGDPTKRKKKKTITLNEWEKVQVREVSKFTYQNLHVAVVK